MMLEESMKHISYVNAIPESKDCILKGSLWLLRVDAI